MEARLETNLTQKIFDLDRRVRFVGIINEDGKLASGGMKEDLSPFEPTKKDEDKLYLKWFLVQAMTDGWDEFLGKKTLVYTRHEKVDMYGIPLGHSRFLLVSVTRTGDFEFLGDRLLELATRNYF